MATCSTLQENPTVVTLAAAEHCVNLSEHDKSMPLKVPNVFQDMIGLSFLWVPHVARSVLFVWAQEAFAVHVAATTEAFEDLPYYCAGDVLEFLDLTTMARAEMLGVLAHRGSPSVKEWVHELTAAAVAVSTVAIIKINAC